MPRASTSSPSRPRAAAAAPTRQVVVLDTSVLIGDPTSIHAFKGCDLVVPLTVIEELDGLKSRSDDVGRNARQVLRSIEELRTLAGGSLTEPVALPDDATLTIALNGIHHDLLREHYLDPVKADNRIIGAALGLLGRGRPLEIYSQDASLRLKAAAVGLAAKEFIPAAAYRKDTRPLGWHHLDLVDPAPIDALYRSGHVAIDEIPGAPEILLNEFAVVRCGSHSALARCHEPGGLRLLGHHAPEAWGLRPRSKEQRFLLELLLDPDLPLVAASGPAGTGKTLVSVAAGLEQVVEQRRYERVAVYRPLIALDQKEIGFLPGRVEEKVGPHMAAIHDAVVALTERRSADDATDLVEELTDRGQLTLEPLTFLRGRTLHNTFIILDEAQNTSPTEMKALVTRLGENSKLVVVGDTTQIDVPFMSEHTNGLSVLQAAFAGQEIFGRIRLTQGERSAVATLAADLL